jgi:hypothetical protein
MSMSENMSPHEQLIDAAKMADGFFNLPSGEFRRKYGLSPDALSTDREVASALSSALAACEKSPAADASKLEKYFPREDIADLRELVDVLESAQSLEEIKSAVTTIREILDHPALAEQASKAETPVPHQPDCRCIVCCDMTAREASKAGETISKSERKPMREKPDIVVCPYCGVGAGENSDGSKVIVRTPPTISPAPSMSPAQRTEVERIAEMKTLELMERCFDEYEAPDAYSRIRSLLSSLDPKGQRQ